MNKTIMFNCINLISILFFGILIKISISTNQETSNTIDDVQLLDVGLARTVHCIDHEKNAILQCKPKHVLVVHSAQWSDATCQRKTELQTENPPKHNHHFFDRTQALQQLCDGLTYCFLKPSKVRNSDNNVAFFGDPLYYHTLTNTTNTYSLTVSVSCLNRELHVRGRKVTDTIVSKEHNVEFGCNEDEVIHLSVTRVDGYAEEGPNRSLTLYNFGPHVFDCNMKQKCTVTSEQLKKCETGNKPMVFGTGVLVYYCRKPLKFAFCDHVKVKDQESSQEATVDKFVLFAEQDSQVTVQAPIFNVLKSESAYWSSYDKLTDNNVRKDRLELVRFLCDDRNYCAFTPKRSAAGAHDSSFEEVHFGGILNEQKNLVLLAHFKTKKLKDLTTSGPTGLKTKTVNLGENLSIQCEQNEEGTLHILSAVAGPRGQTGNQDGPVSVKFKDLTKVVYRICYRKRTCDWNLNPQPVQQSAPTAQGQPDAGAPGAVEALQVASILETASKAPAQTTVPGGGGSNSTSAPTNPLPAGLENQEITVKYLCRKYTHDPSLIDRPTTSPSNLQLSEATETPVSLVDKEQAETVALVQGTKLFINLEVFGASTVNVGEVFTIKVPGLGDNNLEAEVKDKTNTKLTHPLTGNNSKYVFFLGFVDQNTLEFSLNASDGATNKTHTHKFTDAGLTYPISLKDVVKADGSIVGMRVYLLKTDVNVK